MIAFHDVRKTYLMGETRVEALRGVTAEITAKCMTAVTGPSGSGKSTMLHLAGCLDTPTGGLVTCNGVNLGSLSPRGRADFRASSVGFVFQKFNLVSNLTALRNVELPLLLQGESTAGAHKKALEALALVELSRRSTHKPAKLSGGEQQRVAIARALVNDPPVILADEPTGNLDTGTGQRILMLLQELVKLGKTVVVVTHNPEIVGEADGSIVLRDGKVDSLSMSRVGGGLS